MTRKILFYFNVQPVLYSAQQELFDDQAYQAEELDQCVSSIRIKIMRRIEYRLPKLLEIIYY